MGLLLAEAEYIAKTCLQNNISGSLISLGRLDYFITVKQFAAVMLNFGLASVCEQKADSDLNQKLFGIQFVNKKIHHNVLHITEEGLHINKYFTNKKFISEEIVSDVLFYTALGFDVIDCLDSDSRRGYPSIVFNLNESGILNVVNKKYNLVIDGGVMEHVFDIRNTMLNITDLLEVNGFAIHILPSNNTMDHGFYQFSPTLFRDYYLANKYNLINVSLLELQQNKYAHPEANFVQRWDKYRMWDYDPWLMGKSSFGQLSDSIYFTLACAQKKSWSLRDVAPHQYLFQEGSSVLRPW